MKRWLGGAFAFVAFASMPHSAKAAETLYGVTFFSNELISINVNTGAGTLVGALDSGMAAFGLGSYNGKLYAYDQVADRIRQLSTTNGSTLATIDIGIGNIIGEGGLAFRSDGIGFLSSAAGSTGQLFSFDIVGGTSTPITGSGGLDPSMDGLAFTKADVLYGMSQGVSQSGINSLYTINTTTGATTLVGSMGVANSSSVGGFEISRKGVAYATFNGNLYRVDLATGDATLIGNTGFSNLSGLAFVRTGGGGGGGGVPEPGTWALLAGASAGLLALRRNRQK